MAAGNRSGKGPRARRGVGIALVGCNHKTAPVEVRERVSFGSGKALAAAAELRALGVVEEAVVLSTCNRSELYAALAGDFDAGLEKLEHYFSGFHGLAPEELSAHLYRRRGPEAAVHLYRVAAGLDSMLLGEAEILGQVREAYRLALEHGSTGPVLNRLFQGALEVGKRVRTETEVGTKPMSVAYAGVKLAERVFGSFRGRRALIVGAGAMAEQAAGHLRTRGIGAIRVVNRSVERANELARRVGGETAEWGEVERVLAWPDIVIASVSAEESVLRRMHFERAMEKRGNLPMFVADLGLPRNVEPGCASLYNLYVYNLDELGEIVEQNRKAREAEVPHAEELITGQLAKFEAWQRNSEAIGMAEVLRTHLEKERQALQEEHREFLAGLGEAERQRVIRMMEELLERIVRQPERLMRETPEAGRRAEQQALLRAVFGLGSHRDES
jgi:glutamyl-tRNA reductase